MITTVIQAADLHVRNMRRHEEVIEQFSKFIEDCRKIVDEKGRESVRIVLCGDIAHQKINISSEQQLLLEWFFRELDDTAQTLVIAGNHDFLMGNKDRIDALTPVFKMAKFKRVHYLDRELGYKSGVMVDDNVAWALYSAFDDFAKPNLEPILSGDDKKLVIGLYHGDVVGGKTDGGRIAYEGMSGESFQGCAAVMAGHIHKRQELKQKGIPIVYSGSLIQQDNSESVTGHGYVVWDLETMGRTFVDLPTDYGYYKFEVKDISDIENDKARLVNL